MNFAFYGQATTTDRTAARAVRADQLADATARVQRHGGRIVTVYFDVYPDRLRAWRHRQQAHRLLHAIASEPREFDAVVIGDTHTALTAAQYDDLLWYCVEHDVQLWVPEIDGPINLDSGQHQTIMRRLFWGRPAPGNRRPAPPAVLRLDRPGTPPGRSGHGRQRGP